MACLFFVTQMLHELTLAIDGEIDGEIDGRFVGGIEGKRLGWVVGSLDEIWVDITDDGIDENDGMSNMPTEWNGWLLRFWEREGDIDGGMIVIIDGLIFGCFLNGLDDGG